MVLNKKLAFLLSWLDILYLVVILFLTTFLNLNELITALLSLPFFIIIPFNIGKFFLNILTKYFNFYLLDRTEIIFINWCIGSLVIFILGMGLGFLGAWNIIVLSVLSLLLAALGKFALNKDNKIIPASDGRIKSSITIYIILFILSILPLLFVYCYWPFPLKFDSDGFGINMLSLEFIKNGVIPLQSYIHLPFESILLSIPSFLFGVFPYAYLWMAPFVIYPVFSLAVFSIARVLSDNNIPLALAAGSVSVWFTGGVYTVSELFLVLPRNLIVIFFLFFLTIFLKREGNLKKLGKQNLINLALVIFVFSIITFSISPSENHFNNYYLFAVLLFSSFLPVMFYKKLRKIKILLSVVLSLSVISLIIFVITDISFPSMNLNFFIAVIAALGIAIIIFALIRPYLIDDLMPLVMVISMLGLIIYHQIWFVLLLAFSLLLILWSKIRDKANFVKMVRVGLIVFLLFLALLYSLSSISLSFISSSNLFLINQIVGITVMVLFFVGLFVSAIIGNTKELFIQLIVCAILLIILLNPFEVGSARMIDFIFPFIAFYAVYPTFALLKNFGFKFTSLNFGFKFSSPSFRHFSIKLNRIKAISMVLCFIMIVSPILTYSMSNFVNDHKTNDHTLYTFSDYEYQSCWYIKNHYNSTVFIITDTFTALIVAGLSGNSFSISFRIPYDQKGNTRPLLGDSDYLLTIRNFLKTTNQSEADESFSKIRSTIESYMTLNKKIGAINFDQGQKISYILFISGRTSAWLSQETNRDIVYPQNMSWLLGYQKFFDSPSYRLVYQNQNEVYVFEILQS